MAFFEWQNLGNCGVCLGVGVVALKDESQMLLGPGLKEKDK